MFKNYLKIAIRNLFRQKAYSAINIFGFALGLLVCLIICFYVIDELTFDNYHTNGDRIYRVISNDNSKDWVSAVTCGPLIPAIKEEVPEISAATRVTPMFINFRRGDVEEDQAEDAPAVGRRTLLADPEFFDVFDFEILAGEQDSILANFNGVYLTQETAQAVFGDDDPVGKPLNLPFAEDIYVAGIVEAPPTNSHLQFGAIARLDVNMNPVWWDSWENFALTAYVLLDEGANYKTVENKVIAVGRSHNMAEMFTPVLQPLLDMHLGSNELRYDNFNLNKNDKGIVYGLIAIGVLVLLVASINFINLSSARSSKRAREVGMRKVVGANRWNLVMQFLGESVIIVLIALLLAMIAFEIVLPHLDTFLGKHLDGGVLLNPLVIFALLGIGILVGILSGVYPALILSGFDPVGVLKGEFNSGRKGILIRRILVVSQFAVSITLIIGVLIVLQQIDYMQSRDMGYDRDRVVVVPAFDQNVTMDQDLFREKLETIPSVKSVGRVNVLPGRTLPTAEVFFGRREGEFGIMFDEMAIDDGFIETMDISILQGRNFSREFISDTSAVLINETAFRMSGWDDAVGKNVIRIGVDGLDTPWNVIGVIKDVHFGVAKRVVEPMLIRYRPRTARLAVVRLQGGNIQREIEQIQAIHQEVFPDREFRNFPFDEVFANQFNDDRNFAVKIGVFAGLAILISCLGLFGLSSFTTEQRKKEIGIRKVLGSSISQIVILLSTDFTKWVILANIIAWPLAYYTMNKWLQNFAYRTSINPLIFVLAGTTALIIALVTVSFHAIRSAAANPVNALKYE